MFGHNPIASNPFSLAGISQPVFLTGVSGTETVGSVVVEPGVQVLVTGVVGTVEQGSVSITGSADVDVVGVATELMATTTTQWYTF